MANENPELFRIHVGVKRIDSPTTRKPLSAALTFDVTREPLIDKGVPYRGELDPQNLVVRPGDAIEFAVGKIEFDAPKPILKVKWKSLTGKEWAEAPVYAGKRGQVPARAGFGGQVFCFRAEIDLRTNLRLPAQIVSTEATTLVGVDPEVIVDEC